MSPLSRLLTLIGLAFVALLIAAWLLLPRLIAAKAVTALRQAGFPQATVGSVAVSGLGLKVERISLAPDDRFTLDKVRVQTSLGHLRALRASRIDIGRVTLRLDDESGWAIPGYVAPASTGQPTALPFDQIHIRQIVANAPGDLRVELSALDGQTTDGVLALSGDLRAAAPTVSMKGTATAAVRVEDFTSTVELHVTEGDVRSGAGEVTAISGTATLDITANDPLAGQFDLVASQGVLSTVAFGPLKLAGALQNDLVRANVSGSGPGGWQLQAVAVADLLNRNYQTDGKIDIPEFAKLSTVQSLSGAASARFSFAGAWPKALADATGSGSITLTANNLALPDTLRGGSLDLAADITLGAQTLHVTGRQPWRLNATILPAQLPPALAALGGKKLSAILSDASRKSAPAVTVAFGPALAITASGALALSDDRHMTAALQATALQATADEGNWSVAAPTLSLNATNLPLADLTLTHLQFSGAGSYTQDDWQIAGPLTAEANGKASGYAFTKLRAHTTGRISKSGDTLRFLPEKCLDLTLASLSDGERTLSGLTLACLRPVQTTPLVAYDAATEDLAIAMTMTAAPLEARYRPAHGAEAPVRGQWPDLKLTARLDGGRVDEIDARFTKFDLNAAGVALQAAEGALKVAKGRVETATLNVKRIASLSAPPVFAPLKLSATTTPAGAKTAFEAHLGDMTGAFVLEAKGSGTVAAGDATLKLYPLMLIPEAQEIVTFLPALGQSVSESTGLVAFDGGLAWAAGKLKSHGTLTLTDIGLTTPAADLSGLNAAITFASLLPPATATAQTIKITLLNAGLPLTDGEIDFNVSDGTKIAVTNAHFKGVEGSLATEPFTVDLADLENFRVSVIASDLKVANIFALTGIDGLHGSGFLNGRIPLVITPAGLRIDNGALAAGTTGTLTYDPAQLPGFLQGDDMQTQMLRQVLKNFQYEKLSLAVNGLIGDNQTVTLAARGSNPDFLDGHPIELNVNLNGPLANVLRSAIAPYSLPEALQKQFQEQEKQP